MTEKNLTGFTDLQKILRCREYLFYGLHNVAAGSKLFYNANCIEITGFQGFSISVSY
jgi:hypothetical protein